MRSKSFSSKSNFCRYRHFLWKLFMLRVLFPVVRSFTKIYNRNFEISLNFYKKGIMHELKAGLNADKLASFWMCPKRFYHSFVLQMYFCTLQPAKHK